MNRKLGRLFGGALLAATVLVGLGSNFAHASTVTVFDATYYNHVQAGLFSSVTQQASGAPTNGFTLAGSGDGLYGPTTWSAKTLNDYGMPRVSVAASAGAGAEAVAESDLTYYVEFAGADGGISVPLQASGSVSSARASLLMRPYSPSYGALVIDEELGLYSASQSFAINQDFNLVGNEIYQVTMQTFTSVNNGGSGSAYIDPYFVAPAGYTLITSSGIGNAPAVTPIPAALPLFATALVGLGLIGWRRKKMAAALAA